MSDDPAARFLSAQRRTFEDGVFLFYGEPPVICYLAEVTEHIVLEERHIARQDELVAKLGATVLIQLNERLLARCEKPQALHIAKGGRAPEGVSGHLPMVSPAQRPRLARDLKVDIYRRRARAMGQAASVVRTIRTASARAIVNMAQFLI